MKMKLKKKMMKKEKTKQKQKKFKIQTTFICYIYLNIVCCTVYLITSPANDYARSSHI